MEEIPSRPYAFPIMTIAGIRQSITALQRHVDRAIWTESCSECGRRGSWVCATCQPVVRPTGTPDCARCGVSGGRTCECADLPVQLDRIQTAYPFRGWVRSSIHRFKFRGEFARSPYLAAATTPHLDLAGIDLLVPVPIHRDREHDRGFNQSALLARDIAAQSGIPMNNDVLIRSVKRRPQVGRSLQQRWDAVAGVFTVIDATAITGRHIAVVDDVITTGATVSECAVVLMASGAASVSAIAIARG